VQYVLAVLWAVLVYVLTDYALSRLENWLDQQTEGDPDEEIWLP